MTTLLKSELNIAEKKKSYGILGTLQMVSKM